MLQNDFAEVFLLLPIVCLRIVQKVRGALQEDKKAQVDDDSDDSTEEQESLEEREEAGALVLGDCKRQKKTTNMDGKHALVGPLTIAS